MKTVLEEFFYGSLRSMKDEYLERTLRKLDPEVSYLNWIHDRGLGDDNVEVFRYDEEGSQSVESTYRSSLCYKIAEQLARSLVDEEIEEIEDQGYVEPMSKYEKDARYRYQYKLNGYTWKGKKPHPYMGIILEETQV